MYNEEYMPTIEWVPGVKNPVADLLSRYPIEEEENSIEEETFDMTVFNDPTIRLQIRIYCPIEV